MIKSFSRIFPGFCNPRLISNIPRVNSLVDGVQGYSKRIALDDGPEVIVLSTVIGKKAGEEIQAADPRNANKIFFEDIGPPCQNHKIQVHCLYGRNRLALTEVVVIKDLMGGEGRYLGNSGVQVIRGLGVQYQTCQAFVHIAEELRHLVSHFRCRKQCNVHFLLATGPMVDATHLLPRFPFLKNTLPASVHRSVQRRRLAPFQSQVGHRHGCRVIGNQPSLFVHSKGIFHEPGWALGSIMWTFCPGPFNPGNDPIQASNFSRLLRGSHALLSFLGF